MVIVVRPATAADQPALRELFLLSRRTAFAWEPPGSFRLNDFDAQTEGELLLVAPDDGRLEGFVSVWEPDRFIHHLHVHPLCFRRGIGGTLLRALPGWPTTRYRLKCLRLNQPALAFYRACGFAEVDAEDGEYLVLESGGEGCR